MCRGNRKRDVTTMVTYSHATTPLGQSERAYYLSYFINTKCIYDHLHITKLTYKKYTLNKRLKKRLKNEPEIEFSLFSFLPSLMAMPDFSVVSAMYDMVANMTVVRNPETPLIAEPTNSMYKGHSKYITKSTTTVFNNAPMVGAMRAGFLLRVLSVQGPQKGATISEGMAMKNMFPVSIFVARL